MNFFISRKNVSFMRYLDFCAFVKSEDFKLCSVIMIINIASYIYVYFFWTLSTIKIKLGQILQYCMINIFKMLFAQCWTLETSSMPCFIKMAVKQYLLFLNETFSFFELKHLSFIHIFNNCLLISWSRLLNCKGSGT